MAEWVAAADLTRCPPGNMLGVEVEGHPILLANVDGDVYAVEDRCSHEDYPLSDGELEGTEVECIYHGARFDVCSGRATCLPAIRPVKTYEVDVRDGTIYVRLGD
ncbi:MAG: non-heme iron oxygenase ferredoxin subunit [Gemmatimonadetes bacterium]|nr:MAG: non-heme iron oxygenase ferredoxin subunit [Gemmatimonadota bacterium]